jgi:hypothetical protein
MLNQLVDIVTWLTEVNLKHSFYSRAFVGVNEIYMRILWKGSAHKLLRFLQVFSEMLWLNDSQGLIYFDKKIQQLRISSAVSIINN